MPQTSKKLKGQIGLGLFICPSIFPPTPSTPPRPHPIPPLRRSWRGNLVWACSSIHPSTPQHTHPSPLRPPPTPPPPPKNTKCLFRFGFCVKKKKLTLPLPASPSPPPPKKIFLFKIGFIVKKITYSRHPWIHINKIFTYASPPPPPPPPPPKYIFFFFRFGLQIFYSRT